MALLMAGSFRAHQIAAFTWQRVGWQDRMAALHLAACTRLLVSPWADSGATPAPWASQLPLLPTAASRVSAVPYLSGQTQCPSPSGVLALGL